jgi:hypothetical protein
MIHLPWGYTIDGFVMAVNVRNGIYPADRSWDEGEIIE